MKIGRNDKCWCGSGRKYKGCHLAMDERLELLQSQGKFIPDHAMIKNEVQIAGIREASKRNTEILDMITEHVKEGISTGELNRLGHEFTLRLGGIPAPLHYDGFPKSICTSVDEVVCHGIPDDKRILRSGDIVNIDMTTMYNGYYGDSSRMFLIGEVSPEKKRLVEVCKESLELGVAAAKPWAYLGDVGHAVNSHAIANGFTIVEEIGGHGIGLEFHEDPWVSHVSEAGSNIVLVEGMVFTIEPMMNMGKADIETNEQDGWTVTTLDKMPSAQWEYTILVTKSGSEVLAR